MNRLSKAMKFSREAHEGQVRKYTGEPYINHPLQVAMLVLAIVKNHTTDMLIASILHDTVEDTNVTLDDISKEFGREVAGLVEELTNVSKKEGGNRKTRKEKDRQRLAKVSPEAQTIKLADRIDNVESICKYDPNFAKVYMKETKALLEVLTKGDKILYKEAQRIIEEYENEIRI